MLSSGDHFNWHNQEVLWLVMFLTVIYLMEAFRLLPHICLHLPEDQLLGWSCCAYLWWTQRLMGGIYHSWRAGPYCDTHCENSSPNVACIFWPWVSKPFSVENLYLYQNTFAQFILPGQNLSLHGKRKVMEYNLFHSSIKPKWQEEALC